MQGLKKTVPAALASVTLENIKNFFRKSRDYMYAYLEGMEVGKQLDAQVKVYKSHRRVGANS